MMDNFMHDEFRQLGTDYASPEEVAAYDRRMRQFRDIDAENDAILHLAGLRDGDSFLEIGTGTGALARRAAKICRNVRAVDASEPMLAYAAMRAEEEKLSGIRFEHAGFLSFEAEPETFDAAASGLALHHLSDVWKSVALKRIARVLKPGVRFVLIDVVFTPECETPEAYFGPMLDRAPGSRANFAKHIADELSTLDWIMTGLLERAGFSIEKEEVRAGFLHTYLCIKR